MPGASISANLGGIIFKIFWGSMPPDPPRRPNNFFCRFAPQKNFLGANLTPANSRKLTTMHNFRFPSHPAKTCQAQANNELSTAKNQYFWMVRETSQLTQGKTSSPPRTFLKKKSICESSLHCKCHEIKVTFFFSNFYNHGQRKQLVSHG